MDIINKYRTAIKFVVIAGFVVLVLSIVLNYSLLNVAAPDPAKLSGLTIAKNTEVLQNGKLLRLGINIVKNGPSVVKAVSEEGETAVYTTLKPFKINKITIDTQPQKSVDKLVSNGKKSNCAFDNPNSSYNYECHDGFFYRQDNKGAPLEKVPLLEDLYIRGQPKRYKNGVLVFVANTNEQDGREILIFTDGTVTTPILSSCDSTKDCMVSTRTTSEDSGFLVTNVKSKKMVYYQSLTTKSFEYSFAADIKNSAGDRFINPSLIAQNILINYYEKDEDTEVDSEHIGSAKAIKYKINTAGLDKPELYDLSKIALDDPVCPVSDKTVYVLDLSNKLSVINLSPKPKVDVEIHNVQSVASDSASIYYVSNDSVYKYSLETKTANLLRRLASKNISHIETWDGSIILTGNSKNSISAISTYGLSVESVKSGVEPFDLIPYSLNELPILNSDFYNHDIFFSVLLNSQVFNPKTGASTYDQKEYTLKKESILRRLQLDALNLNRYNVVFKAGP